MDYAQAVAEQITLNRPQALAKNDYVETYTYYCATRALMERRGLFSMRILRQMRSSRHMRTLTMLSIVNARKNFIPADTAFSHPLTCHCRTNCSSR